MRHHIGSPAPELKGGQIHHEGQDVTWLVVCTIERPSTPYIAYDVIESDLESGFLRVMQLAIARLAHLFCDEFEGAPYSFFREHDEQDRPIGDLAECVITRQFQHMEGQLYNTQLALDHLRKEYNSQGREIASMEESLRVSAATERRLKAQRKTHQFADFHLHAQVRDLEFQLAASQAKVKELEEESRTSSST